VYIEIMENDIDVCSGWFVVTCRSQVSDLVVNSFHNC